MPVAVKSDARWVAEFRARFDPWWREAEPRLAAQDEAAALAAYPWPALTDTPWTPFKRRLSRCRVAMVTTGGLFRPGIDVPFDGESLLGDSSFRVIPATSNPGDFAVAHRHFPHAPADADINTIFPLALLHTLADAGVIGYVAPTHYSTIGHVLRADDVAVVTAPTVAELMWEEGVDVALVIPVSPLCHQSSGLLQRELEASGIPTISVSNDPTATERVRAPRSVRVPFPCGSMFGEPGNRAKQRQVLTETLMALTSIPEPGGHVTLDVRWEGERLLDGSSS